MGFGGRGSGIGAAGFAGVPPTFANYSTKALGGFSNTNTLTSAAGQIVDFRPGQTMWLVLQTLGTINANAETIIACNSGTFGSGTGFWLVRAGTASGAAQGKLTMLSPSNHFLNFYAPPSFGITVICITWRASDSHILCSVGGAAQVDYGQCLSTAAGGSAKVTIGGPEAGFGTVALTSARILAIATWSTEASATQAQNYTFSQGNRFTLPSTVTSAAVFNFAATMWDGVSSTVVSGGSSPITLTVGGTPTLTAVAERRYVATQGLYFDSRLAISGTSGSGYAYTTRNSYAQLKALTDARYVDVEAYSTIYADWSTFAILGCYINGSYSAAVSLTGAGPQIVNWQVSSGTGKTVALWEGPCSEHTAGGIPYTRLGSLIQAVRVPTLLTDGSPANSSMIVRSAPGNRVVVLGDSIATAWYTSNAPQTSPIAQMRVSYPTAGITAMTAASDAVGNIASTADLVNLWAARIVAELDGTVHNTVVNQLSTNDYGVLGVAASTFQGWLAALMDAVYALATAQGIPGFAWYELGAIQRISPASEAANGGNSTLGDFRTAKQTLVNARAWAAYIEGGGGAIVSNANMYSDGIHIVDAGAVQLASGIGTPLHTAGRI